MKKFVYFQFALAIFFVSPLFGQSDSIDNPYDAIDTLQDNFGLFENEEILNISLRFDIIEYRRKKPKEEYMKAILTYHINDKDSVNKEIKLKSRGEFRNEFCSFPPIRLNFKKVEFEKEDLKKIEKIKLVTHCNSGNETNLFKEYLIYKLYNVITDYSFRVRLVNINYINTHKKSKPIKSYAFLIEPIEFLAKRTNSYPVNSTKLSQVHMAPEMMDRMAIFNYMIGNTDWSVPNQHNCKILSDPKSANPNLGLIVPYDFDYSGLVNANYAIPHPDLGIETVRERIYLGLCRTEDVFLQELKEFSDKKEELYKVINDFTYLDERAKKDMIEFLQQFYDEFDKRNTIVNSFLRSCKKN